MRTYTKQTIEEAKRLRALGYTYSEIKAELHVQVPQSTLSNWCHNIPLPFEYQEKIEEQIRLGNIRGRAIAVAVNKRKRDLFFQDLEGKCVPYADVISDIGYARIALTMLCLGEASKYSSGHKGFSFGNSNPEIITIFLSLLKRCFDFDPAKVRCRVQCRADQDIQQLELFWQKVTGVNADQFYSSYVDRRTIGKPTKRLDYNGVVTIHYFDVKIQHELEMIAKLVYKKLVDEGP